MAALVRDFLGGSTLMRSQQSTKSLLALGAQAQVMQGVTEHMGMVRIEADVGVGLMAHSF